MAWFKVDDGFYTSIEVLSLPRDKRTRCVGLWMLIGTWCAKNSQNGSFHESICNSFSVDYETELHELIKAKLVYSDGEGLFRLELGINAVITREMRAVIPKSLREAIFERDDYSCNYCGSTDYLQIDHIYPWSLGGKDEFDNLQVLCRSCNIHKGAKI